MLIPEQYFDNNSYYYPDEEILQQILNNKLLLQPLNASAIHMQGQIAHKILEDARDFILELFTNSSIKNNGNWQKEHLKQNILNNNSCQFFNLVFTSSATESNNLAVRGCAKEIDLFLYSACEHKSILESIPANKPSIKIPCKSNGQIDQDYLFNILKENQNAKIFLSIIYINNETGVINNLDQITQSARKIHNNLIIHSDFSQAVGKIADINIAKLGIDMISFTGYKFGAMIGAAGLIFNKKVKLHSIIKGGGQENLLRGGTENIPAIHSMHLCLAKIYDQGWENFIQNNKKLIEMREYFEQKLKTIPDELNHLQIFGHSSERPIPTSYFSLNGVLAKPAIIFLSNHKIYIGSGSACSAGLDEKSHVLSAMNFNEETTQNALRVSFGPKNTLESVDLLITNLKNLYNKFNFIAY